MVFAQILKLDTHHFTLLGLKWMSESYKSDCHLPLRNGEKRLQSRVLMDTDEHGGTHLLLTFSNNLAAMRESSVDLQPRRYKKLSG